MTQLIRVATYSRISTLDKGQNIQVQASELRQFCLARGWSLTHEVSDEGISGSTDQRPGLKRLLTLMRTRQIDLVLTTKLDRIARSLRHLISFLDECNALSVAFVSVRDQIDLTTAAGRLMIHLIGAFAEFERTLIRERTIAGLAYAKSQGKTLGRPKKCDDASILKLRNAGLSYTAIQERLGVSRPSIRRAILSEQAGTQSPIYSTPKTSIESEDGNG